MLSFPFFGFKHILIFYLNDLHINPFRLIPPAHQRGRFAAVLLLELDDHLFLTRVVHFAG